MLPATWVVDFKNVQSTVGNPFSETWRALGRQQFKVEKSMQFFQGVPSFVARSTMADPSDAPEPEMEGFKLNQQSVAQSLACLDGSLLRQVGQEASCSMLQLLYKIGSDAQLLSTSRQTFTADLCFLRKMYGSHLSKVSSLLNGVAKGAAKWDFSKFEHILDADQSSMSTLLVLCGILMALLLDDGADTSILYASDFRNSVVRML